MNAEDIVLRSSPPATSRKAIQDALEASKKLQHTLAQRTERLEAKLKAVDALLEDADVDEVEDDPEPEVLIPGAKRVTGLFSLSELLSPSSPFHDEAMKRTKYLCNTRPRSMKAKDIEALAAAVRQENERLQAYKRTQGDPSADLLDLDKNLEGLDWARIAEKVSDSSSVKRTPTECRVIWVGDQHPDINHDEWHKAEINKLNAIVQSFLEADKAVDWVKVSQLLGTKRTPIDCMRHGLSPQRHNWTTEADQRLLNAVESCGIDNWQLVARKVSEYVTSSQCQGRWQKSLNPALKRRAWTAEEDERLRKAVAGYGNSWVQVATAIPGRTNDQCRERWIEHLRPAASSTAWTETEDEQLIALVESLGNKWATISSTIGNNKTGQNCRVRYERLKKKKESRALAPRIIQSFSPAQTPGPSESSQSTNLGQAAPPTHSSEPADLTQQLNSSVGGPSPSQSNAVTSNIQFSFPSNDSVEVAPTKSRPKPRPRRSNRAEHSTEFSNTGVTDNASDGNPLETSHPVFSQPMSSMDVVTSSHAAAIAPFAGTSSTLPVATTKGKRRATGQKKVLTDGNPSPNKSPPADLAFSDIQRTQQIVGDGPSKVSTRAEAPLPAGKRRAPRRTVETVVPGAPPDHPPEVVEQISAPSHKRKRKVVEDALSRGSSKKARANKPLEDNLNEKNTSQTASSEPSQDASKLRRGRSRKNLPAAVEVGIVHSNEPSLSPAKERETISNS